MQGKKPSEKREAAAAVSASVSCESQRLAKAKAFLACKHAHGCTGAALEAAGLFGLWLFICFGVFAVQFTQPQSAVNPAQKFRLTSPFCGSMVWEIFHLRSE